MKVNKLFVKKYYLPQKYIGRTIDETKKYTITERPQMRAYVIEEIRWFIGTVTFQRIKEYNDNITKII